MESRPREEGRAIRVFFLGSGSLSIAVLDALHLSDAIVIAGIGSQPDRFAGRQRKVTPTPLAAHAAKHGHAVLKPSSVNSPEFLAEVESRHVDVVIVVAFGQLLKQPLLDLAPQGCLNVHASLLPRHRGAAPVSAAILADDDQTGISFMRLNAGMDTGPVYREVSVPIPPTATTETLEAELSKLAADEIVETVIDVVHNGLPPVDQDDSRATYAAKLKKADGIVDWNRPAEFIERMVRAYQPWPRAACFIPRRKGLRRLQISDAAVESPPSFSLSPEFRPGQVVSTDTECLFVACGQGILKIERLIPEGSREMSTAEFLRGTPIDIGTPLLDRTSKQVQTTIKGL